MPRNNPRCVRSCARKRIYTVGGNETKPYRNTYSARSMRTGSGCARSRPFPASTHLNHVTVDVTYLVSVPRLHLESGNETPTLKKVCIVTWSNSHSCHGNMCLLPWTWRTFTWLPKETTMTSTRDTTTMTPWLMWVTLEQGKHYFYPVPATRSNSCSFLVKRSVILLKVTCRCPRGTHGPRTSCMVVSQARLNQPQHRSLARYLKRSALHHKFKDLP